MIFNNKKLINGFFDFEICHVCQRFSKLLSNEIWMNKNNW